MVTNKKKFTDMLEKKRKTLSPLKVHFLDLQKKNDNDVSNPKYIT
jgi:hypothetical protein